MALAIRLRQQGRKNHSMYRIVVIDSRAPRDGKYLEVVGWFNPLAQVEDLRMNLKADRVQHWLSLGAQMTESVEHLVHKSAPSVTRWQLERRLATKAKAREKRKARKSAAA